MFNLIHTLKRDYIKSRLIIILFYKTNIITQLHNKVRNKARKLKYKKREF